MRAPTTPVRPLVTDAWATCHAPGCDWHHPVAPSDPDAQATADRAAERHTRTAGHPTTSHAAYYPARGQR